MATTIWKAAIGWDGVKIPVGLRSAVEDRSIHFRLLHDQDLQRVKQRLVNPDTGETVAYSDAQKGLEIEKDVFVLLDEEDLASLEPAASRDIDVLCFCEPAVLNHQWYDRPYYLSPDGSDEDYFALVQALEETGQEGICRWVMRRKQYLGALRVHEGYLVLVTLRFADEILPVAQLAPEGKVDHSRHLSEKELKMAKQLVSALEDEFDHEQYRDEYRDRVAEFIRQKQEGETPELPDEEPVKPRDSLEEALAQSLQGLTR